MDRYITPRAVLVIESLDKRFYASIENNDSFYNLFNDKLKIRLNEPLPAIIDKDDKDIALKVGDIILMDNKLVIVKKKDKGLYTRLGNIYFNDNKDIDIYFSGSSELTMWLEWDE